MPAYNAEHYISFAIESVLKQTYNNWELIIIDDNSCDKTAEIVSMYINMDSRIHLIKNIQNIGASYCRNQGILTAQGNWIAFLDSDDLWALKKLELQMQYAYNYQADFLFTGSCFIDETGRKLNYFLEVPLKITYKKLLKQNLISCSSVLIRKELLIKYKMPNDHIHEDFATWLQILSNTKKCAYGINLPLITYRIHANSKSGNKSKAAIMTYKVYRYIGLSMFQSFYYWCWYAINSLNKYSKLKQNIDHL